VENGLEFLGGNENPAVKKRGENDAVYEKNIAEHSSCRRNREPKGRRDTLYTSSEGKKQLDNDQKKNTGINKVFIQISGEKGKTIDSVRGKDVKNIQKTQSLE